MIFDKSGSQHSRSRSRVRPLNNVQCYRYKEYEYIRKNYLKKIKLKKETNECALVIDND